MKKTNKTKQPQYTYSVGRRREAVARVRLFAGKGKTIINGKSAGDYFPTATEQVFLSGPLEAVNVVDKFYATVRVVGGGKNGQLGAVIHGLSRALTKLDPEKYRQILKEKGFLTRDPRTRERRKYGHAHSARAKKQSPKR